ncbi:MAG: phosphopentomutase [Enterobacterales bacterium]|nr:phosphopentomutase [Enterobacterales bacterium]
MPRVIVLVMDSLGIGATPDANLFGDEGANTFGHIANWCAEGNQHPERKTGCLDIPNLLKLGFAKANQLASGVYPAGIPVKENIIGMYAACKEISSGKDTPSGHWEMMGVPVEFEWGYFPITIPCFSEELVSSFIEKAQLEGILGNCHASGTEIIEKLGMKHMHSDKPICYTSSDSVFQIAAHEETFGLDRLYEICEIARGLMDDINVGRVIARPFIGTNGNFKRTGNRRDYTTPPPAATLLDKLSDLGREVYSVGKIADIFAHRGISHKLKANGHDALFDATLSAMNSANDGSLIFTNFVEFDQSFGHRRDVGGYAAAIESFDIRLGALMQQLDSEDLMVLTADHGCDPTWPGNDHTREHVPFIAYSREGLPITNAGIRESFCDIGQTIAKFLQIAPIERGQSAF